jgi:hypothetical protein
MTIMGPSVGPETVAGHDSDMLQESPHLVTNVIWYVNYDSGC